MATFRFKRQQLEALFGEDYDGLRNFELMLQEVNELSDYHSTSTVTTASTLSRGTYLVQTAGITLTMPVITEDGTEITVVSDGVKFTLAAGGTDTIEGSASDTIYADEVWTFKSFGTDWKVAG